MSFLSDIVGLVLTMLFAGFLTGVVLPSLKQTMSNPNEKKFRFSPVLFLLGALAYPLSFGVFAGVMTFLVLARHIRTQEKGGKIVCCACAGLVLTCGALFGGAYGFWDLFLNRYCIYQPFQFVSETCDVQQNLTLPINYQLQGRYLQINQRVIYDTYATPTNASDSIGAGASLAVFGQSNLQRCSAPGAPWTYQDGQSVEMWNPTNSSNLNSGQWIHSADRKIIWQVAEVLPYSTYHVYNCRNEIQYIVTTETDFSTLSMFTIKIHNKNKDLLAMTNQQFTWTSTSFPFTKQDGEVVGTLSQHFCGSLSSVCFTDHWNVNVKKQHKGSLHLFLLFVILGTCIDTFFF